MVLRSILSVGRAIDEQGYCQVCGEQDGEDTFEETVLSSLPLVHEIPAVCRQVAQEWNSCNLGAPVLGLRGTWMKNVTRRAL